MNLWMANVCLLSFGGLILGVVGAAFLMLWTLRLNPSR